MDEYLGVLQGYVKWLRVVKGKNTETENVRS